MPTDSEFAHLREETQALNDQVKLLVRTEQRLARSQSALDRQAQRLRALSEFSLWCSSATSQEDILVRALTLLQQALAVDDGVAADVDSARKTLRPYGRESQIIGPQLAEALTRVSGARMFDGSAARALADELGFAVGPPETLALLALRRVDHSLLGLIAVARGIDPAPFHRDPLSPVHLSFVQLVAAHAEQAVRSINLNADLRARSQELAEANHELTASMDRLAQAQKLEAIGRLAGGIAHDFNNLLTAMVGHAEMIHDALPAEKGLQEDAGQILEACRQAAEITSQLLAFSRKTEPNAAVLDLNQLAVGLTRMLGRLIGERIALRLDLDPGLDLVRVDRGHVEQIIVNLVVNARDAMPAGGTCVIATRAAAPPDLRMAGVHDLGDWVALSVIDDGVGISDEIRAQMFEPFFTTKLPGEGTGLGLATVHGLVTNNGGHILVKSAPQRGSRFTILFPAAGKRSAGHEVRPGSATVLVVDDADPIRRIVHRALARAGYRVIDSRSAEQALDLARETAIDLLVTDVVMPRLSGVELAARLRSTRPDLPVIYISGYTFDRFEPGALQPGDRFLAKPFAPQALCAEVASVLSEQGKR